jgi:hypothetical protein
LIGATLAKILELGILQQAQLQDMVTHATVPDTPGKEYPKISDNAKKIIQRAITLIPAEFRYFYFGTAPKDLEGNDLEVAEGAVSFSNIKAMHLAVFLAGNLPDPNAPDAIALVLSHLCHIKYCCDPDHLIWESSTANGSRNHCNNKSKHFTTCGRHVYPVPGSEYVDFVTCTCGNLPPCKLGAHMKTKKVKR